MKDCIHVVYSVFSIWNEWTDGYSFSFGLIYGILLTDEAHFTCNGVNNMYNYICVERKLTREMHCFVEFLMLQNKQGTLIY
jgi:hypothetical protein